MSLTLPNVEVDSTAYVSLNTATGIAVGSEFTIQCRGVTWANLVESSTQPDATVDDGTLITNLTASEATKIIPAGSLEIWAISTQENRTSILSVQPTS